MKSWTTQRFALLRGPAKAALAAVIAALAGPAAADPVASTEKPTPPPPESHAPATQRPTEAPTAADVAGKPEPGNESGRTDVVDKGDGVMRKVARALLFFPKEAVQLALDPIRGGIWLQDRYDIEERYFNTFYNKKRTVGLFPTASYESGYGLDVGARLDMQDAFGWSERFGLQATTGRLYGEQYRDSLIGSVRTGNLVDGVELALDGSFLRRPFDPYYGIGNDNSMQGHYRYQEKRVATGIDVHVADGFHIRGLGAATDLVVGNAQDDPPIEDMFPPDQLVGFPHIRHLYGEVELRLDSRRAGNRFEPRHVYGNGSLVSLFAGRVHRLEEGTDFWRYGGEVQHFFHIMNGPRLLIVRGHFEAVTGSRDEVPFIELPALGGGELLRGYDFLRFRDRVAALTTVQYMWDLSHFFDAELFVDAGRVYESVDAMTLSDLRVGYGVGLQVHSDSRFLFETSVASSIDGGLFVSISFNPIFDARPRWR